MRWDICFTYLRVAALGMAAAAIPMLEGCSVNMSAPSTNYTNPVTLQGQVFAGRNYMANATVKVYATQPNGIATNGSYAGKAKLLATVTTNTIGTWKLTGISCSSPDQLYVTAEGGTPYGSGTNVNSLTDNPNSLMMTAIGDCSILSSASNTDNVTSVVTNEASTIAAVWALRNFISLDGTTVNITSSSSNYAGKNGVGVPGNYAGLVHAFLNANTLAPYKVANFPQYTAGSPDGSGGGLIPVQELNSLAYAQYLCTIGSDGKTQGSFSYCTTLYQLATPPGGTAPTNSLAAMLNIARYPANNAAAILAFTLTPIPLSGQSGSQQINAGVYVPALTGFGTAGSGGATDWSVAIYYTPPYGAVSGGQGSTYPSFVTLDANDDAFFSNPSASTSAGGNVIALTSSGANLWTSTTDSTNLINPHGIAADANGHIWVSNYSSSAAQSFIQEMDASSGAMIARYPSSSVSLWSVAADSLGNIWYGANSTIGQNLHELQFNGSTYTEASFPIPPDSTAVTLLQIWPDSNNNIWVAGYNSASAQAVYFPNTGTAAAPTYTAGLQFAPLTGSASYGVTVDSTGDAYTVTNGSGGGIFKVSVTGSGSSAVPSGASVATNTATTGVDLDTDGAGNIWYMDHTTGTYLYQYSPASGAVTSFYPCYNAGTKTGTGTASSTVQTCSTGISTRWDMAIDSTGSMWVASYGNSGGGRMVQIIGLAAPTVPLRALGESAVMP